MTIIEAIQSGKDFRRKGQKEWIHLEANMIMDRFNETIVFGKEAVLANDWETRTREYYLDPKSLKAYEADSNKPPFGWIKVVEEEE